MNETTITLPVDHLKAAVLFAPKADVRYYLVGVHVRVRPNGETVLSATCGHTAARIRSHQDKDAAPVDVDMILPRAFVELAIKTKQPMITLHISAPTDDRKRVFTVTAPACNAICQTIDGVFPDVRRIMPRDTSGKTAFFNPELLARFSKARAVLVLGKTPYFTLAHNGDDAAAVCIGVPDTFAGVVMPIRASPIAPMDWTARAWASE